jgi:hypothetical protein
MASHLRSSLQRATLFANKRACIVASINSQPMALSHQLAPAYNQQTSATDLAGKIDKNIVTSPHSDCELHGLTLVQRYFQNASKYSNKIALVCIQFISNLILFRNCSRVFYYLTGIWFAGMRSDRTQIHIRDAGPPHPKMRERFDTSRIQKRRRDGDHFAQRSRIPRRSPRSCQCRNARRPCQSYFYPR